MGWSRWATTVLLLALLGVCITIIAVRFAVLARRVPIERAYRAPAAAAFAPARLSADERGRADAAESPTGAATAPEPGLGVATSQPGNSQHTGSQATSEPPPPDALHKLDVNSATALQLERLPGIGPVLAKRIVDYRKRYGPFRHIDDLDKVKGIGPAKLAKLRDYVYIRSVF